MPDPNAWKTKRREDYLSGISAAEQAKMAKFMGTGPDEPVKTLAGLTDRTMIEVGQKAPD